MNYDIPIHTYTVTLGSRIPQHETTDSPTDDAWIYCAGAAPGKPSTQLQLWIRFRSPGQQLPPNTTVGYGPVETGDEDRPRRDWERLDATIYVESDHYTWFLDALRNEKCTARLFMSDEPPAWNRIQFQSNVGWGNPAI